MTADERQAGLGRFRLRSANAQKVQWLFAGRRQVVDRAGGVTGGSAAAELAGAGIANGSGPVPNAPSPIRRYVPAAGSRRPVDRWQPEGNDRRASVPHPAEGASCSVLRAGQ